MLEYRPLKDSYVLHLYDKYRKGCIPVLDIEMSSKCIHGSCIYCDSKVGEAVDGELSLNETNQILEQGLELGVEMVTICGLGEPLDDPKLFGVLEYCRDHHYAVSMFTNLLNLSEEYLHLFSQLDINLIVKCDSLNSKNFDKTLGRKGSAQQIYNNIDKLLGSGFGGKDCTNLAFSIVPTKITFDDIPEVVRFCKSHGIFPSIGEIEYSGKGKSNYQRISLTKEELLDLKAEVEMILGYPYRRQICPSTFASLHITNLGECVVHSETGLSCPWFLLSEPEMVSLGNIRMDPLEILARRVSDYRSQSIGKSFCVNSRVPNVFGGCGGKADEILEIYTSANNIDHQK